MKVWKRTKYSFGSNAIVLNRREKTRPSILCVTHQMSRKKRNYSVG